jgi:hypothetical protein
MTWGFKVRGVTFTLGFVALLALASGANWVESIFEWLFR